MEQHPDSVPYPQEALNRLLLEGKDTEAAGMLKDLLRRQPDQARAHNDLALLYLRGGGHRQAWDHLLRAFRLDPHNTQIIGNIIHVCHALGLTEQAAQMRLLLARVQEETRTAPPPGGAASPARGCIGGIDLGALHAPVSASQAELQTLYWTYHPRFRFLKGTVPDGTVLDLGAGGGGLASWTEWLAPRRSDLRLYAVDMVRGPLFDRYAGAQICNLDEEALRFEDGFFDAAVLSHLLEHITDPEKLLQEVRRTMKSGGRIYVEVPTPESCTLPSRRVFLENGIDVSTVNFFDDGTHRRTFSLQTLAGFLLAAGFTPCESGLVENKFLEDSLLAYGAAHHDQELTTYGVWSKLRFAHYIVAEAIEQPERAR